MRRPFKKVNNALGVIGLPSAVIGAAMVAVAAVVANTPLLVIGAIYAALGFGCLALRFVLGVWGDAMRRRRGAVTSSAHASSDPREGLALILVLMVTAILSLLVVHALQAASVARRAAESGALHDRLARYAAEAAWYAVQEQAVDGTARPRTYAAPDGTAISVEAAASDAPRGYDVEGSRRKYSAITARATTNERVAEVYCLTVQDSAGAVGVARWVTR